MIDYLEVKKRYLMRVRHMHGSEKNLHLVYSTMNHYKMFEIENKNKKGVGWRLFVNIATFGTLSIGTPMSMKYVSNALLTTSVLTGYKRTT